MPRVTKAQMVAHNHQSMVTKYTELKNEVFKLHKYLVEHPLSEHTIDSKDVHTDAIKLIEKLGIDYDK